MLTFVPARRKAAAFTVLELVVSMLVLLALVGIALIASNNFTARAAAAAATQNLRTVSAKVLADASMADVDHVERGSIMAAMEEAGATVVDGLSASSWHLGGVNESPSADGAYAAGFAVGTEDPQDDGGNRAAIVVHGGGKVIGQVLDLRSSSSTRAIPVAQGTTPADLLGNADEFVKGGDAVGPPTGVRAAGIDNRIDVSWTPVAGAVSYVASTKLAAGARVASCETTGVDCSIGALPRGAAYQVSVTALFADGRAIAARPVPTSLAPAVPADLSKDLNDQSGDWAVSWPAADGATGYLVEVTPGASAPAQEATTTPSASGNLVRATALTVRVRATSPVGPSEWSAPLDIARGSAIPSGVGLAIDTATGSWTATWPAAEGAQGYAVETTIGGKTTATAGTETSISGTVAHGATVSVRVASTSPVGQSPWSEPTARTRPAAVVHPVTIAVDDAAGTWTASWNVAEGAGGYEAQARISDGPWEVAQVAARTAAGALEPGATVTFRVRATAKDAPASEWSAPVSITRAPTTPLTPTVSIDDTTGAWSASWDPAAGATGYSGQVKIGAGAWTPALVSGLTAAGAPGEVPNGTQVQFQVLSSTAGAAPSAWSPAGTATRAAATPAAPTVTIDDATGAWAATWSAATGAGGYGARVKVGTGAWTWVTVSGLRATSGSGAVPNGVAVQVQVRSTLASANPSPWSPAGTDTRAPADPAPPTVTVDDATGAWSATWPAAVGATGYIAQVKIGTGPWSAAPVSGRDSSGATGAVPNGAPVHVQVRATTAGAAPSAWSPAGTATRAAATPAAPAVTVDPESGEWSAAWPAADAATGYQAQVKIGAGAWTSASVSGRTSSGSGVAYGQRIEVQVRATLASADPSAWSPAGTAVRAPATPSAPAVTIDDATGAWSATWSAASAATGYIAQVKVGTGPWSAAPVSGRSSSGPDGAVPNGAVVQVQVRSTLAGADSSAWSAVGSATRVAAVPGKPSVVVDDATGAWSATWPAAAGAGGYAAQVKIGSGSWSMASTSGLSSSGPSNSVPYGAVVSVRVLATVNDGNPSDWSVEGAAVRAGAVPGAPTVDVSYSTGAWTASWAAASGAQGYEAQVRIGGGAWSPVNVSGRAASGAAGAVAHGVQVEVQVRSTVAGAQPSAWSPTGSERRAPATPVVTGVANSTTRATFTWPAAAGATEYYVGSRCDTGAYKFAMTTTRSVVVNCQDGDTASVSVRADRADGSSLVASASVGLSVAAPTGGELVTWSDYPNNRARLDKVSCPAGTVIQSRQRTRLGGETFPAWSSWSRSGRATQSGDHGAANSSYATTMAIAIQVSCLNADTNRASTPIESVTPGMKHVIVAPTNVTASISDTRRFTGSATCQAGTTRMFSLNLQLSDHGYNKTWPDGTGFSVNTDASFSPIGNYRWTVTAWCTADGVVGPKAAKTVTGWRQG